MYVFYLSYLFISNTDKHEFNSIWKWLSCSNDVMNHADCEAAFRDYLLDSYVTVVLQKILENEAKN